MSAPSASKIKTYKELLTTSLHRRFVNASLLVLAFCWLEATLFSTDSILTAWFPFGYTGIRALLLFIPCLNIFIIRLYNLHFGKRTTRSGFQTFYQSVVSTQALVTLGWYIASSQFFGLVYIWTKGAEGHLGWVDQGRAYERARVNENPVMLRFLYLLLAIIQTGLHIYQDLDMVPIVQDGDTPSVSTTTLLRQITIKHAAPILKSASHVTISGLLSFIPVYYLLFFRKLFWTPTYLVAKLIDHTLPSHAGPTGASHEQLLVWQGVTSALFLSILWAVSNAVFTVFMAQKPIKKQAPLTGDMVSSGSALISRAVDANATLINGLSRKKESPRTFALWELYLICTKYDARRKSIFAEVDRAGGSTWSQLSQHCLKEISGITVRIEEHNKPSQPQAQPAQDPAGLPRIATASAKQGEILTKSRPDLMQAVSGMARSAGQHPGATNPLSPTAKKAITWSADRMLSKEQQQQLSLESVDVKVSGRLIHVLQTPLGEPFRQTFARTANAVVLGSPYSSQTNIKHAARSLATLLKASLTEDICGVVAKDVPLVIRTFLAAITSTRNFLETLQPDWTDVHFQANNRQVPEILETIAELRSALESILLAFAEYAPSLGMSKKELREAKEAVGMNSQREMAQLR